MQGGKVTVVDFSLEESQISLAEDATAIASTQENIFVWRSLALSVVLKDNLSTAW